MGTSKEVITRVCKRVKEARKEAVRVEFAGLTLFERHCGKRMARVRVFEAEKTPSYCHVHERKNERRSWDEIVCTCPDCNYQRTDACYD